MSVKNDLLDFFLKNVYEFSEFGVRIFFYLEIFEFFWTSLRNFFE